MIPAIARLKRAVSLAIGRNGGKDSAALTVARQPSTVGRWHNVNDAVFPPIDCAFELDQLCMMLGDAPPILSALAAELGHVLYQVPEVGRAGLDLSAALLDASAEFGDIAGVIREATRDDKVCARDRSKIVPEIDHAMVALARLRAVVNALPDEA